MPRAAITICAPGNPCAALLGLGLADGDTDALTLADGLTEALGLTLGETEGLGLLIASRTAKVTIARSSLVPLLPPTGRLPCPAVVSMNTHAQVAPMSISGPAVLLAPAVGGVWCPKCPPEYRRLFVPGEPSVTLISATAASVWARLIPVTTVFAPADCVTAAAHIVLAVLLRVTTIAAGLVAGTLTPRWNTFMFPGSPAVSLASPPLTAGTSTPS